LTPEFTPDPATPADVRHLLDQVQLYPRVLDEAYQLLMRYRRAGLLAAVTVPTREQKTARVDALRAELAAALRDLLRQAVREGGAA
jgi:hypothetical protein